MKKYILLFVLVVCAIVDVQAQMSVSVRSKKDGNPLSGVIVYSFATKKSARLAFDEGNRKDNYANSFNKRDVIQEVKTGSNGICYIDVPSHGALILDGGDASTPHAFSYFLVEDFIEDELDSEIELVLDTLNTGDEKIRTLGEAKINAMSKIGTTGSELKRHGKNYITLERDIDISGDLARNDARFVAMPTIYFYTPVSVEAPCDGVISNLKVQVGNRVSAGDIILSIGNKNICSETTGNVSHIFCQVGDSVQEGTSLLQLDSAIRNMPPAVVDGRDYTRGMVRRTSFQSSRDKLDDFYFDKGIFLTDHQKERIRYSQLAKITKGTKYKVPGLLWYEDYNSVYHEEPLLFADGTETEPMRLLNWDAARQFSPIDRDLFFIKGHATKSKDSTDFKIKFEQGKEFLNLRDTSTVRERDNMIEWLSQYYNLKEGELSDIEVLGYSSPEGTEARNRVLSHGRAKTITQLLKGYFPEVKIKSVFDKHDNIVPWEIVADSMALMNDTLAHRYANEIRTIISDKNGFDAQYRAIRANKDLYDYLDKYVLDRVRIVRIKASIIVNKVLTKEEIIERYETDHNFRKSKLLPYQSYIMMCYFADREDWDQLYKVANDAYHDKRMPWQVVKQIAHTDSTTKSIETFVPYPLAGYYYAVASMRKGIVNTDILKPYLDDGPAGSDRKYKDVPIMNSLPFIVAQVLMYCQDESFDGANRLIKKYNLMQYPQLTGLIMFVRCLDGQYTDFPEVRNYVMSTSSMNKAVILSALGKYDEALGVLYGDDIPENDSKVEYLRAICLFKKQTDAITRFDAESIPVSALYEDNYKLDGNEDEQKNDIPTAWAVPMLNAFKLDKKHIEYFPTDGYFNNAYRQMILYAWERMQAGVSLQRIADEYNALIKRMKDNKKRSLTSTQEK